MVARFDVTALTKLFPTAFKVQRINYCERLEQFLLIRSFFFQDNLIKSCARETQFNGRLKSKINSNATNTTFCNYILLWR